MADKEAKLSTEDLGRLIRLYEEASAKLYEAGLIVARNLGLPTEITGFQLANGIKARSESGPDGNTPGGTSLQTREIAVVGSRVYFVTSGGCGYWDLKAQICVAGPCS